MTYWMVPLTFLVGGLAGGLVAWHWRGRNDAVTTRQKIKLVVVTVFATVALLLLSGYGYLRYRLSDNKVDRASTSQALSDFRKGGGLESARGTPAAGVYTFNTKGGIVVKSALLGDETRKLPPSIPAVLRPLEKQKHCWELTLRIYKQNHRGEVYCKDDKGLRLERRWERDKMFGIKSFTRQGVQPPLLVGPAGRAPDTKFQMVWKVLEHKTTMPVPVKRPDLQLVNTYVGQRTLTIGGQKVKTHHLRQHASYRGGVSGTLDREVYYAVDTGMMVKLHVKSLGKGIANVTIDRSYTLASLTPKQ